MKETCCLICSLFFIVFLPSIIHGASLDVIINEIAWMGTADSANDEWIELYNNTNAPINLEGWILKADDGTPKIDLTGTISPKDFYLLERTDESTLAEISADLIYKGALENGGENLKLYDGSGNLIDEVKCEEGWFSGDNKTKQTMERINSLASGNGSSNWQNSQNSGGTPKAKNDGQPTQPTEKQNQKLPDVPENSPPEIGFQSYPSGIVFNEILPSPEGPDSENEWIEILNQNDFGVNLSGWRIKDNQGRMTTYTFPPGTKISPKGYLILSRPETKITLNNDSDKLDLIQPNGEITDSVAYKRALLGQSYNRTRNEWLWSNILTPGRSNIIHTKEKTETRSPQASNRERAETEKVETRSRPLLVENGSRPVESFSRKGTARVGENLPKSSNFFPTILIASALAVFSGVIILILKKKIPD